AHRVYHRPPLRRPTIFISLLPRLPPLARTFPSSCLLSCRRPGRRQEEEEKHPSFSPASGKHPRHFPSSHPAHAVRQRPSRINASFDLPTVQRIQGSIIRFC
ncbi:hypothetical protein C8J56DRAFT_939626, partial [Mycena floridula]